MNTKFNTQAMFFPGFYESILENSDSVYYETEDYVNSVKEEHPLLEIDADDDVEVDYKGYRDAISKAWAEGYSSYLPKDIVKSCEYDDVVPPRNTGYGPDYRYGTDKLYVNVELVDNWLDLMKQFIEENLEWFKDRILKDWSSYDGFWSFMENDIDGWIRGLEEEDERYVGTTLAYMAYKEHGEFWDDINMDALDAVSLWSYINLTEEKQKEMEELTDEELKEKRRREFEEKHQLKIDFPS